MCRLRVGDNEGHAAVDRGMYVPLCFHRHFRALRVCAVVPMSKQPVVSVVMVAVDSDRKWLGRAVKSVANQRGADIQLVLVDNTSTLDLSLAPDGSIKEVRIVRNPKRPT